MFKPLINGSSKSRMWYGSLFHACEKCYEWPGRASVNTVETLCVMEICMGVKKCYESHGCVSVQCAPKHMDDCEPNSRAPFLTGRHGWLKIQSKCKQKLSNTHGWITNRPTQCLGRKTKYRLTHRWFWDAEKSPTKKINFGSLVKILYPYSVLGFY